MRFVCDPLSIALLTGLVFVFVLLAIFLGYAITVLMGLRRIVRKLTAISDEVESVIMAPFQAMESVLSFLMSLAEGWFGGSAKGKIKGKKTKPKGFETKELS